MIKMKGVTKRGNTYTVTVSQGYDPNGKQIRVYKTYTPPEGASEIQIMYELEQLKKSMSVEGTARDRMTVNDLYKKWKATIAKKNWIPQIEKSSIHTS